MRIRKGISLLLALGIVLSRVTIAASENSVSEKKAETRTRYGTMFFESYDEVFNSKLGLFVPRDKKKSHDYILYKGKTTFKDVKRGSKTTLVNREESQVKVVGDKPLPLNYQEFIGEVRKGMAAYQGLVGDYKVPFNEYTLTTLVAKMIENEGQGDLGLLNELGSTRELIQGISDRQSGVLLIGMMAGELLEHRMLKEHDPFSKYKSVEEIFDKVVIDEDSEVAVMTLLALIVLDSVAAEADEELGEVAYFSSISDHYIYLSSLPDALPMAGEEGVVAYGKVSIDNQNWFVALEKKLNTIASDIANTGALSLPIDEIKKTKLYREMIGKYCESVIPDTDREVKEFVAASTLRYLIMKRVLQIRGEYFCQVEILDLHMKGGLLFE